MVDSPTAGLPASIRRYDVVVKVIYVDETGALHEDEETCMDEITEAAKDLLVQRLDDAFGDFQEYMADMQVSNTDPTYFGPFNDVHRPKYDLDKYGDFELMS